MITIFFTSPRIFGKSQTLSGPRIPRRHRSAYDRRELLLSFSSRRQRQHRNICEDSEWSSFSQRHNRHL